MEFLIRPFRVADSAAVNQVVLAAFSEFRHAYSDWEAFSCNLTQLVDAADSSEVIVAEQQGRIVGAVGYVGPGQPKRAFFPPEWPIVRLLVVDPSHRGLGIGHALMQECVVRAQRDRAPLLALHTSSVMKVALPMYERMGFVWEREAPEIFGVRYGVYVKRLAATVANLGAIPYGH